MNENRSSECPSTRGSGFSQIRPSVGDMDNPLHITGIALGSLKNTIRLYSRFQTLRKYIGIRTKTLVRILVTKWWNSEIRWYERQLLEVLLGASKKNSVLPEYYLFRSLSNGNLKKQVEHYYHFEYQLYPEMWFPRLFQLLYSHHQFNAVMGLRRIKFFFQCAFVKQGPEQSGKPRLKRQRIRGYRDGKGKPMDPGLRDVTEANRFYYNLIDRMFDDYVELIILDCNSRGP